MNFSQPLWLLAGLFACAILVWRYHRFDARQRTELAKFASTHLTAQLTASVSPVRRRVKRALVIMGIGLLATALARPVAGFRWEETRRKGLDLVFAVDTSRSMLAQDVRPDRLTRAKMAVDDLLGKADGDRVGLIAFAGNAFLQCPLTLDYDAFRQSLDALDTKIIPRGGTDIAAGIREAEAALAGNGNNERILVLLTDGEDLEGSALNAARAAAKRGLKIFAVGIGSANGELIPLTDETGGTQFLKDASGQFVKSRLDETMLRQIAEATGGMYQPLGQQSQGLEIIYQQGLSRFTRHEVASRMQKVYLERFQWPLALGLFCLVLEPLLGIRRRTSGRRPAARSQSSLAMSWNKMARPSKSITAAAALALVAFVRPAQASVGTAETAFQKGDYIRAEREYGQAAAKSPDEPVLQFNHGAAAYKAGQFEPAVQSFAKAVKAEDSKLQEDNFYNLGNSQYRLGQQTEPAKPDETLKNWQRAVQSYEAALKIQHDDADATYNRDLVKRKIEELKKKQQQQPQNQKQKNQDQKDRNNQNKQQDQASSQGRNDPGKQENQQKDKSNGGAEQQPKQDAGNNGDQNQQKNSQPQSGSNQDQSKQQANHTQPNAGQTDGKDRGDEQAEAGQKPEQKSENAQAAQKQSGQPGSDGQPQARNPQPAKDGQEQADVRPEPGKMSREEARQLLDSLKSDDRQMPLTPYARGNDAAPNDQPVKDW